MSAWAMLGHPPPGSPWSALRGNLDSPLGRLLLQLIVIISSGDPRRGARFFARSVLPTVVGERSPCGILLGPSLLGWLWPGGFNFVFAASSLEVLRLFSQIGVTVFMFVVGMELEVGHLAGQGCGAALVISQASILVPFACGAAAAMLLYSRYAGAGTSLAAFALFLGIAMSVTAFPVLVRIPGRTGDGQDTAGQRRDHLRRHGRCDRLGGACFGGRVGAGGRNGGDLVQLRTPGGFCRLHAGGGAAGSLPCWLRFEPAAERGTRRGRGRVGAGLHDGFGPGHPRDWAFMRCLAPSSCMAPSCRGKRPCVIF